MHVLSIVCDVVALVPTIATGIIN